MPIYTRLDEAIGRLRIQLVLTERDTERASYWYTRAVSELDALTAQVQFDGHPFDPTGGGIDDEPWVPVTCSYGCGLTAEQHEAGPRRAGERPYQPTGRPAGHGEPAYETTDPAQSSTLPPTSDNTREP